MASLCRTIRRNGLLITPRKVEQSKPDGKRLFKDEVKAVFMRLVSFLKRGC